MIMTAFLLCHTHTVPLFADLGAAVCAHAPQLRLLLLIAGNRRCIVGCWDAAMEGVFVCVAKA